MSGCVIEAAVVVYPDCSDSVCTAGALWVTVIGDITTPLERRDDSADLGTRNFSNGAVAST